MKKLIYGAFAFLTVFFGIPACNKYGDLAGQPGKLVASAYQVKISQPDTLLLYGAKSTDTVHWSVSPSGYDSLITKNNAGLIFFKKAGVYQVTASDNAFAPATASITVSDSVYQPKVIFANTPLSGNQITLAPGYYKSKSGDTSYIYFVAQTMAPVCSADKINYADSIVNNSFDLQFVGLRQSVPCNAGVGAISAGVNFSQNQLTPLANGTYPLSVTLNGTTYSGNIVVSSTTINFIWNYTSGVLISPKQLNR